MTTPPPPAEPVGDPVCWLHELCPECGAVPSPEVPDRCWRCGTPRTDHPTAEARVDDVRGPSGFGPFRVGPVEPTSGAD
jgi:hypothetical protein